MMSMMMIMIMMTSIMMPGSERSGRTQGESAGEASDF